MECNIINLIYFDIWKSDTFLKATVCIYIRKIIQVHPHAIKSYLDKENWTRQI